MRRSYFLYGGVSLSAVLVAFGASAVIRAQSQVGTSGTSVTFNKDVLPILQKNCQGCHRPGQIAPMSLLTYSDARPWAKAMKVKVESKQMPPWFVEPDTDIKFRNDPSLSQKEIDTIVKWADAGAPAGDAKDAPPPVKWPEDGWNIRPDIIVRGPDFVVPAHPVNNVIEWTNIYVPSGFTKDTWVTSLEVKPSDLSVTHHICIVFVPHRDDVKYYTPEWTDRRRDEEGVEIPPTPEEREATRARQAANQNPNAAGGGGGTEVCYLPGNNVEDYRPFGAGKLVPAGTDIRFQVHYTPSGKDTIDRPLLGFTVTDTPPAKRWLSTSASGTAGSPNWQIPPNEANWAAPTGVTEFGTDAEVVLLQPHMHVRGKDMKYVLEYPDGRRQVLLDAKYDFNWQLAYLPEKPLQIPKGSKIYVDAHYNNSASNKFNPNPNRIVYSGQMTWEEMMLPYLGVMVPTNVDPRTVLKRTTLTGPTEGGGAGAN